MTSRILLKSLVAALPCIALAGTAMATPNLVTNGSFETTTLTGKGSFSGNVAGWGGGAGLTYLDFPGTADNGTYLSVYGPFPATSPDGGNFVEADGDPNYDHAITQTISGLIAGALYNLTFYQAAGQQAGFTGSTTERFSVSFGDASIAGDTQLSSQFSLPQGGVGQWQSQSLTFTAHAASQVLSFLAVGTPNGAPPISFLDGVSLTAVPEPASLAVFGLGVAALGAAGLRRRASRSTAI